MSRPDPPTSSAPQLPAEFRPDRSERPLVVVTVGSDHHPFDRLIGWVDRWLHEGGAARVDCLIQYGTARSPLNGRARAYVDHSQLLELMGSATVVIMQGGPIGIAESRRLGRLPIVVPRLSTYNEVVDDHQVTYSRAMAAQGKAAVAESEAELRSLLEVALKTPSAFRTEVEDDREVAASVHRFAEQVSALARWDDPADVRRGRWWARRHPAG